VARRSFCWGARSRGWLGLLALQLAVAGSALDARAADEKISPEARAYFKNGVELLQGDRPNYQDAYYQFKLAYDKSQSWKVLGNLGLCAVKLERDGEALTYYQDYLRRGGKDISKDEREAIERDLLLIKGNGATLELSSSETELELQDERSGSTVGRQNHEFTGGKRTLFVRAGEHRLTAKAKDGRTLEWQVNVDPGRTVSHEFDFNAPAPEQTPPAPAHQAQPGSPPPPVEAPAASTSNPVRLIGFITTGVGVAALGGGLITGLMANSKQDEATSKCDSQKICDPAAEPLFEDAESLAGTSNVLWIGGGVVTAAGIAMIVFGKPSTSTSSEQARSIRVVPVLGAGVGGLFASGTF
jgi:hypothetical protein